MELGTTESEALFERFSESRGWRVRRIDPHAASPGSKVPDFILRPARGVGIVVEVKQFDPNPEECEQDRRSSPGEVALYGTTPGKRLRSVISKAAKQLKAFEESLPGMLVVYNRTIVRLHDDRYAVLTAMRGLDVVDVQVPVDPRSPPVAGPVRPGPGKKLTANMNTWISCIAVLRECWPDSAQETGVPEHTMTVYHNPFARHPLNPSQLRGKYVTHWRMNAEQSEWQEVQI